MFRMMRPAFVFLLIACAASCTAQVKTKAKTPVALLGAVFDVGDAGLRARVFKAQGSSGEALRVFVASLSSQQLARMDLVASPRPEPLQEVVKNAPARVGINGGFYDKQKPMGAVVSKGQTLSPKKRGGGSGVFVIDSQGARVVHRDVYQSALKARVALQSIDRIVDAGKSLMGPKANPAKDARSAVVVNKAGDVLLVAVFAEAAIDSELRKDARVQVALSAKSSTTGVSLSEFAQLLLSPEIAAETALNLDGGYSTAFFAHFGERSYEVVAHEATINALVVGP